MKRRIQGWCNAKEKIKSPKPKPNLTGKKVKAK